MRERPEIERNSEYAIAAAFRVLNADFSAVSSTRVTQFVLGWMRAAFDQSRAIVTLTRAGLGPAAAPNRRSFVEIVVRLQWLHSMDRADRVSALDAMLDHERELTIKSVDHLREMGYDSERDLSEMQEFVLEAAGGALKDQARRLLAAAESTDGQSLGLYYAWREETQYTHATGAMAASYAPASGVPAFPPVADRDLNTHVYVLLLVVTLVYHLLVDENVARETAMLVVKSFLGSK